MLSRKDAGTTYWICILLGLQAIVTCNSIKGPVTCFKCDHMIHAASCNTTTKCNAGEVCAIRKFRGSNGEFQSSGCIKETMCTVNGLTLATGAQIVGKRQHQLMVPDKNIQRRQNMLLCEKCCFGDRCNVLDCTTSSIITSTTAAPACQDKVSQCSNAVYRNVICQDENNAITFCQLSCGKCPIDGGFSSWMPWSDCSVSCGASGESFRVRACDNPKPMYKGAPCQGQMMELQQCNNGPCSIDGHWSAWGQWLTCNATCGGGTSMRIRSCSNPVPRHGGRPCDNPASFLETKQCINYTCPVDGHWSAWGQWLPCNATCGGGTSMRIRSCSNPVPRHGGRPCDNPASFLETKQCNNYTCPVDGHWSAWGQWLPCNATCGGGTSMRIRSCSNPVPRHGGRPCDNPASFLETKQCNNQTCPVDGHWSAWGQWLPCNATCGSGTTMRVRSCSNPVPRHGGRPCDNPASFLETKQCNNQTCHVDGHWSAWGQWLPCNATWGGGGTTMRIRSCSNPVPRHGGRPCDNPASFLETKQCNNHTCPVDGHWSTWGQWLPCNATCGVGTSMRIRSCSNPVPRYGGRPCDNPASFLETKQCYSQTCPVVGSTSSLPTTSSTVCQDQTLCSDPHMMKIACTDLYLATTFCPKLCHKCGPTITPPICSDLVGQKCNDPFFQQFTCQDPELTELCRFTCGKCHP